MKVIFVLLVILEIYHVSSQSSGVGGGSSSWAPSSSGVGGISSSWAPSSSGGGGGGFSSSWAPSSGGGGSSSWAPSSSGSPPAPAPPACEDKWGPKRCAKKQAKGKCEGKGKGGIRVRKNCMKTCGLC